jgi:predicted dehydrogenase
LIENDVIENDKTVRVGLIGYGYAGKTFHAPLIRSVPGLALHLIGSAKREILEAEYPGVLVCSAGEVPAHPDVDLVVIASPNESHFPLAAAPGELIPGLPSAPLQIAPCRYT